MTRNPALGLVLLLSLMTTGAAPGVQGTTPAAQAAAGNSASARGTAVAGARPAAHADRAAEELIAAQKQLADMAADFSLTVTGAGREGGDLEAEGRVWLAAGRRYRVEYTKPEIQVLVSDGKQRWLYLKKINQVQVQPLPPAGNPSELFLELGGGLPALVEKCRIQRLPDEEAGEVHVFELTPRPEAQLQFRRARLWLAGERLLPRRVDVEAARRVRVNFGRVTAHTRDEIKAHPEAALAADWFAFKPPEEAEVIEPLWPKRP